MGDKDFDIKRAYEKWVEQGQPVYSDSKKDSRKSAGKNSDKRPKGHEVKDRDHSAKGQKVTGSDHGSNVHEAAGRGRRSSGEDIAKGGIKSSRFTKKQSVKGIKDGRAAKYDLKKDDGSRPADEEKQYRPKFVADPDAPQCPHRRRCGGCEYIGRNYKWTLAQKEKKTFALLKPYVKLSGIVGMDDPYHYRNKVTSTFAHIKDGRKERNICGIYEQGTHKVVSIDSCLIENEKADAIIRDILDMLKSFKIKVYDEDSGYGLLRHVLVRCAHVTGQIMVVLVLASKVLPGKNNFVKELLRRHPEITTIIVSENAERTSMVLGEKETVIYGKGYIEDKLCGNTFRISSKSFYQVNSVQTEKLYRQAIKYANLTGRERVIDAYCGIGTIGITAAAKAGEVIGVELNNDAVRDAIRNAKANDIKNIRFYNHDAGEFMRGMAEQREKADVIFMDPPRTGSTEAFMSAAVSMSPGRIIYISCEPETLARDLKWLTSHGYKAREAVAYDMFPFTENVETVVSLTKQS